MSGYKADHAQVIAMSRLHTNKETARRLGISPRQVSRILKQHDASKAAPEKRNRAICREVEDVVMDFERAAFGDSYERIAYRHGLTRQAVHKRLND